MDMLRVRAYSPNELIIIASVRRDNPGWHPMLQVLPRNINSLIKCNLIIAYPPTEERMEEISFFGAE